MATLRPLRSPPLGAGAPAAASAMGPGMAPLPLRAQEAPCRGGTFRVAMTDFDTADTPSATPRFPSLWRVAMKRAAVLILALAFAATAAAAQEDPMEVQRCIWRCLADAAGGADDPAYHACVQRQCNEGGPSPAPKAGAARKGEWVFGDHRQLGRSAYGQTAQGAIGLACGPTAGFTLDLRIDNRLFHGPAMTLMFDNRGATSVKAAPGAVTRRKGDVCDLDLGAFKSASTLYLVDGEIASVASDGSGTVVTLRRQGKSVAARSAAQAYRALGGVAVPLAGSSAAIDRLLAACPAARADFVAGCGD